MATLPLPPGSTLGIVGGGQLGRMLALAAARLGFDVAVLERDADSPAGRVAAHTIVGSYTDRAALEQLAALASVVTYEFENVPAEAVRILQSLGVETAPGAQALAVAQDRVAEKRFLNAHGAPTVAFAEADSADAALRVLSQQSIDVVLCDRSMPDKDGDWLIAHMRQAYPAVGVVLATADDMVPPRISLQDGVVAYVVKPFRDEVVLDAVRTALAWRTVASKAERSNRQEIDQWLRGRAGRDSGPKP